MFNLHNLQKSGYRIDNDRLTMDEWRHLGRAKSAIEAVEKKNETHELAATLAKIMFGGKS